MVGLSGADGADSTVIRRHEAVGGPHRNECCREEGHEAEDEECRVRKRGGGDCLVPRFVSRCRRGAEQVVVVQNGTAASQNGRDVRVDDLDGVAADVCDEVGCGYARHVDRVGRHVASERVEEHVVVVDRALRIHGRGNLTGRMRVVERRKATGQGINGAGEVNGEGLERVARAGRIGHTRSRGDVTWKVTDGIGVVGEAGRCQVGAGDVGRCPIEVGCSGGGAAVVV